LEGIKIFLRRVLHSGIPPCSFLLFLFIHSSSVTAPWCGHCKALVSDWEEAAKRLDGEGAFLGWVDATAEEQLAGMYKVQGYPTIKLFPGGSKTYSDAKDYQGGRTAADIVQTVLAEVDRSGIPKPIPELVSYDALRENCAGHNHICVIAALPHILDSGSDGRKAYQETFAKVAKTFRGSAFSFLWFEGTAQPDLEQNLEMTFGFPAVAAFSMDKEAFVVMKTSYNEKNVAAFLHGVTSGRQRIAKISSMPKVETTEPWDGLDAAAIEEEMPLCEIMGTCDEEEEGEL
jgi:protein disulfide-isomerase A6